MCDVCHLNDLAKPHVTLGELGREVSVMFAALCCRAFVFSRNTAASPCFCDQVWGTAALLSVEHAQLSLTEHDADKAQDFLLIR